MPNLDFPDSSYIPSPTVIDRNASRHAPSNLVEPFALPGISNRAATDSGARPEWPLVVRDLRYISLAFPYVSRRGKGAIDM